MIEVMFAIRKDGFKVFMSVGQISIYHKDSCISHTFLLKVWAKNRWCSLYARPLLSEGVNWLLEVTD